MARKLHKHAFSVGLTSAAPTKTITNADGSKAATLVALPLLPASPFRTIDARSGIEFSYDAAALIAAFDAKGRKLPLDIEHNTEAGVRPSDTRARGWVCALTTAETEPDVGLEPGVLYGWVDLNALGTAELADRLYGYTSGVAMGVWLDKSHIQFTHIKSLALTNNPATEMPMTFGAEGEADEDDEDQATPGGAADASTEAGAQSPTASYTQQNETTAESEAAMLDTLKQLLGLDASADEAAISAAIAALQSSAEVAAQVQAGAFVAAETFTAATTEATGFKAQAEALTTQLTAAQAELADAKTQLAALTTQAFERDCADAVATAIAARKITPAQRDSMLAFARADLNAFRAAMDAAAEVLTAGNTPATPAAAVQALTAEEKAWCADHRIAEAAYLRAKQQNAAA